MDRFALSTNARYALADGFPIFPMLVADEIDEGRTGRQCRCQLSGLELSPLPVAYQIGSELGKVALQPIAFVAKLGEAFVALREVLAGFEQESAKFSADVLQLLKLTTHFRRSRGAER